MGGPLEGGPLPQDDRPNLQEALAGADAASGTTALLQALMSVVGEALDRLHARMGNLEEALAVRAEEGMQPSAADEKLDVVLVTLERLSERVERLESARPSEGQMEGAVQSAVEVAVQSAVAPSMQEAMTRLADLSNAVDTLAHGLANVSDQVAASSDGQAVPLGGVSDLQEAVSRLEGQLSSLTAQVTAMSSEDGEQATAATAVMETAMTRLDELSGAVDSIGYGLAGIVDIMSASTDGQTGWPEGLRTALADLGDAIVELRRQPPGQPGTDLQDAVARIEGQLGTLTAQLSNQPGPGAALAMVAAGLAERFEERTQALTELLGAHATYVRETWERIDDLLDGGSFDELAVSEALDHVIDNQERMAESMKELTGRLDAISERPAPLEDPVAHEALASLGAGMEGIGARVDDVRKRMAALAAAMGVATESRRGTDAEGPEPAPPLGRRPPGPSRRLTSDLGLRGRGRQR
jgi:hypothetical protein